MKEKDKKLILFLVFILTIFLIITHFTDTPRVWVDEGVFTETARNFAEHRVLGLQTEPGNFFEMNALLSTGYPVIFPVSLSFSLFNTGIWQARLPMLVYMFILAFLFYLFAKKRYGFYTGISSLLLLISFSPFYGNGRPVQGEVPGLAFLVLGLLMLLYLEEGDFKSKKWAIFSGLAFGLSASTKPIYLFVLSLVLVITLIFWYRKIENKKAILILGLGFILPIILLMFVQFPTKDSLFKIVPTYLHLASNHESSAPIMEIFIKNLSKFFTESTPILFLVLLVTSIVSILFKHFKQKSNNSSVTEFIIISFVVLNWLFYLPGTGWYRYFFPAHVLLYLIFPATILTISKLTNKLILKWMILLVPTTLIILQFYHLVFLSDTSFTVKRTRNTELAEVLSKIEPKKKVLFYGTTEAIIFLKGGNYSQYLSMGDFLEAGDESALSNQLYDVILTSTDPQDTGTLLHCYDKRLVSRYYLFQKVKECKK